MAVRIRGTVGLGLAAVLTGLGGATPAVACQQANASWKAGASQQAVRLAASIVLLDRSTEDGDNLARYSVTVRPAGGTAHDTQLDVTTERPAEWRSYVGACRPAEQSALRLTCDLGEVATPTSVQMTLRVPSGAAQDLGLVAVAGAANAVSEETAAIALPQTSTRSGQPSSIARPRTTPSDPPQTSPSPQSGRPIVPPSHTPLPKRRVPRLQQPQHVPQPVTPAYPVQPYQPAQPVPQPQPIQPPPMPQPMPMQPQQPMQPVEPQPMPMQPIGPPPMQPQQPSGQPAAPGLPNPGLPNAANGPVLPQLTTPGAAPLVATPSPTPSSSAAGPDTSQLSMITSAEVPGSRASWVRVLGIVVVAEVAVLWLATTLGLWRRRSAVAAAVRAGLAAGPKPSRGRGLARRAYGRVSARMGALWSRLRVK